MKSFILLFLDRFIFAVGLFMLILGVQLVKNADTEGFIYICQGTFLTLMSIMNYLQRENIKQIFMIGLCDSCKQLINDKTD